MSYSASTPSNPTPSLRSLARRGYGLSLVFLLVAGLFTASPNMLSADSGDAPVGTPEQATQSLISAATTHVCVIINTANVSGGLKCWGGNGNGQLGNGTTTSSSRPVTVMDSQANPTTPLSGVVSVLALEDNTCALMNTSKVKCWGYAVNHRVGDNEANFVSTEVFLDIPFL